MMKDNPYFDLQSNSILFNHWAETISFRYISYDISPSEFVYETMFDCVYCGKEFKYVSEKKRHEISHDPQFNCPECMKKFSFL